MFLSEKVVITWLFQQIKMYAEADEDGNAVSRFEDKEEDDSVGDEDW